MADSEIRIKLSADDRQATGAFSRVKSAVSSVTAGTRKLARSLGTFHWAVQAFQTLAGWARDLHAWLGRAAEEARRMRDEISRAAVESAAKYATDSYKDLNRRLAETNRLERERNAILERRRAMSRDNEDARHEIEKERELLSLDPASADYEEKRAAVERKYQLSAAQRMADRAREDASAETSRLAAEAARRDKEAERYSSVYDKNRAALGLQFDRRFVAKQQYRLAKQSGDEDRIEKAKAAFERESAKYEEILKAGSEIFKTFTALRQEAESLRRQAGAAGYGGGAQARADAVRLRLEREEREETARREAQEKERTQRATQAEEERIRREREAEERREAQEAERIQREVGERARLLGERFLSADTVSRNRLTAMGLGSGVSARGEVTGDIKRLVALLEKNVKATEEVKDAVRAGGGAVFSE